MLRTDWQGLVGVLSRSDLSNATQGRRVGLQPQYFFLGSFQVLDGRVTYLLFSIDINTLVGMGRKVDFLCVLAFVSKLSCDTSY